MQRVKDWLIKKLGGYTRKEQAHYATFYVGRNMYLNDAVVTHMRQAREWEKRFREADANLAGIAMLNERTCQLVPLRAEIREGMEKFRGSMIPMEELEDWIKRRLAAQLGGGVLAQIGVSRVDDHKNMEFVWACEAYLLKMEEKQ